MQIKRIAKKQIQKLLVYDASKIIGKLADYPCVSFDVFDTLVKRCVSEPAELFTLLGRQYGDERFRDLHITQEEIDAAKLRQASL